MLVDGGGNLIFDKRGRHIVDRYVKITPVKLGSTDKTYTRWSQGKWGENFWGGGSAFAWDADHQSRWVLLTLDKIIRERKQANDRLWYVDPTGSWANNDFRSLGDGYNFILDEDNQIRYYVQGAWRYFIPAWFGSTSSRQVAQRITFTTTSFNNPTNDENSLSCSITTHRPARLMLFVTGLSLRNDEHYQVQYRVEDILGESNNFTISTQHEKQITYRWLNSRIWPAGEYTVYWMVKAASGAVVSLTHNAVLHLEAIYVE